MKFSAQKFLWVFVLLFVAVEVSHAQMINYDRRNRRMGTQSSSQTSRAQATQVNRQEAAPVANSYTTQTNEVQAEAETMSTTDAVSAALQEIEVIDQAMENTSTEPRVTNRVERLYDINRDGMLQQSEVTDFYKDVVSSVRNKGRFKVSSDLLKTFDTNNDGEISRYEVGGLVRQLN